MEIFASRLEIRRRLQARMGVVTGTAQAPLVQDQLNEFIRAAALEVYTVCQWARAQLEARVTVGIDQRFVDYPANATGGNIIAIGVWDSSSRYLQLRRARIQVQLDDEPLVDEGEPASVSGRGQPQLYEPKTQIEIWPRPDQTYELKIDYTQNPELATDATVSVVDAESIILWALADAYDFQGDLELAKVARDKYRHRIGQLRAWASTAEVFKRGRLHRLVVNGARVGDGQVFLPGGDLPNSGSWPAVMPST